MPTVFVISQRKNERKLMELIFPRRTAPDAPACTRWDWPEVLAKKSFIQGFGLFPRNGGAVDWRKLALPVAMPYLGMETEVESSVQARVMRTVLCGGFDLVRRGQLHTPDGHVGCKTASISRASPSERNGLADKPPLVDNPDEELLQVPIEPELSPPCPMWRRATSRFVLDEGGGGRLLHLPHHIFNLLAPTRRRARGPQHVHPRRAVQRAKHEHLLVSAHPIFHTRHS